MAGGLKHRIRSGDHVLGVSLPSWSTREDFDRAFNEREYDFVQADSQHSAHSDDRLVAYCQLAQEFGMPVRYRIRHTREAYLIGRYLDLGPTGVEVPQVESVYTVDEAIDSFYYPPMGSRSFGGAYRVGAGERAGWEDYGAWWNDHGVLWCQVESVAAANSAYALARPGLDCIAFGPVDLTASLHHHPHPRLKTLDDCVRHVVEAVAGTNTGVCLRTPFSEAQKYRDLGVNVLLVPPGG